MRHALKLRSWRSENQFALDVTVAAIPNVGIHELCVSDRFGFHCGLRVAFFEDRNGLLWIIGSRREDEPLTGQMLDALSGRKMIVERRIRGWGSDLADY
jgi:hypothetical protein